MEKFWNWKKHRIRNQDTGEEVVERILELNGTIAEESWFDDDLTPQMFKDELHAGAGNITVWINSPGGDCIAAAQIYNMLKDYKGKVTVKVDGIAASAASVVAMAGDTVLMSPVAMMMIHNPATIAFGDHAEMQKAIDMLNEVKESIINAYVLKTGMSRSKLSRLMDAETWMDANKAVELGFADDILTRAKSDPKEDEDEDDDEEETEENDEEKQDDEEEDDKKKTPFPPKSMLFSRKTVTNVLMNKLEKHYAKESEPVSVQAKIEEQETGRSVEEIYNRLNVIKRFL